MPVGLQAKLLRVLQEGVIEKVGANTATPVDLRVVAATNRDPQQSVETGLLRRDLYFRLNVVRVDVPLLRDRRGDIPLLVDYFVHKYSIELSRTPPRMSAEALAILEGYAWPGNVRELENLIERAMVLCRGDLIDVAHLPAGLGPSPTVPAAPAGTGEALPAPDSLALRPHVDELEHRLIGQALRLAGGNKAAAARLLKISERALWYKIKRYGFA
jgi:two-component system response regulator AtoC